MTVYLPCWTEERSRERGRERWERGQYDDEEEEKKKNRHRERRDRKIIERKISERNEQMREEGAEKTVIMGTSSTLGLIAFHQKH